MGLAKSANRGAVYGEHVVWFARLFSFYTPYAALILLAQGAWWDGRSRPQITWRSTGCLFSRITFCLVLLDESGNKG